MSIQGDISNQGLSVRQSSETVADDAYIDLPDAKTGWGIAQIGDDTEHTYFYFTSAGAVTLVSNSTNAVNTDTDVKFCIFDNGTNVRIKNRLGSSQTVRYIIWYS